MKKASPPPMTAAAHHPLMNPALKKNGTLKPHLLTHLPTHLLPTLMKPSTKPIPLKKSEETLKTTPPNKSTEMLIVLKITTPVPVPKITAKTK
jgi:hypothetical protein